MVNFKPTVSEDKVVIERWIESDFAHRDGIDSSFFVDAEGKDSVYCISDEQGPVMFVRQQTEGDSMRLYTQFPPDVPGSRRRIVEALHQAYPTVTSDAKKRGFKWIVLESESPVLVRYMIGTFGFIAELRRRL